MSGDQNQNQQQQQKQKGSNPNGPKEGITIATSVNPSQSGTLGQQVQGAIVTGIGGAIAALACAGVQKGFDWLVGKWTGRKVRPVFNVDPAGPVKATGNIMQELHSVAGTNPEEARRAIQSVAKRLGMQLEQPAPAAPAPVTVDAGVVEMTPPVTPTPTPVPVVEVPKPVEPAPVAEAPKKQQPQNKGGKK